jgi:amino acid adenylation domain-containing protein
MTAQPGTRSAFVPALFTAQANRTPEAVAVRWAGGELTYEQLDDRSDRLAHVLLRRGAGLRTTVALCAERSPWTVVVMLGILKAGAGYVPLDPEYPQARLRSILDGTRPAVVLTQRSLAGLLDGHDGATLQVEDLPALLDEAPAGPVATAVAGTDLAYVIHTSGSTGRPKGVMISHGSLANHALAVDKIFEFHPGDRVLLCRPLSFDASVEEIFPPLLRGATLLVAGDPLRQTFRALTRQLVETGTTFISVPTAFWHSWILEDDCLTRLAEESALRLMIVAGEKAQRGALSTWKKYVGDNIRWCNVYGPTEGTVTSTVYEPPPRWEEEDFTSVPIGYPIENVRTYVLDEHREPVPAGTRGELYIGGEGVALGYLDAPELTAERFVPDPFAPSATGRLYRTGDIVSAGADGRLEFVGRRDHQVKVRGYRIEPAEVEQAACTHPAVRASVVIAKEGDLDDKRLVCFVVSDRGDAQLVDEVRTALRRELPWFMMPSAIHLLPAFPTTPNGKIDRAALHALEVEEPPRDHVAPRTPTELALARIWEEVLEKPDIGVDVDFFDVGGHSLLAAGIISRVRSTLGFDLPVRDFFESPTIEALAALVTRAAK